MATDEQLKELEAIRLANAGILRPVDVVERAVDADSPLHDCFEWDDSKASNEYRLWQARQLIRVTVCLLPGDGQQTIKAYVSMKADRKEDGGGYRALADVMSDADSRDELLRQAFDELRTFQRKYKYLKELAPIFEAMGRVRRRSMQSPAEAVA